MTTFHDAWLARQRARWLRPNAHLFIRPDAHRFMRPDADRLLKSDSRYLLPAFLEGKANFNPNQPRVPKGNPDGGQWTDEDGGGGTGEGGNDSDTEFSGASRRQPPGIGHNQGPPLEEPPNIPQKPPSTVQEQNAFVRLAARWAFLAKTRGVPVGSFLAAVEAIAWFDEKNRAEFESYQDAPKTLDELQATVTKESKIGYQDHHIGEQSSEKYGIPKSLIYAPENIVRIPTWKHRDISDWYSTKNFDPRFNGLTPREYLRNKSWEERVNLGLEALRMHGVLKP